ncbi:hypothetical protein N9544_04810 [Flavobacteriales bacterium]|nr:hypothetical protein [Flavobacteriales bacterium]
MRNIVKILILILVFFSCKKEVTTNSEYEYNPTWSIEKNYYFEGVIKDTTNSNSLLNHYYYSNTCSYSKTDTIKDSTYFFHFRTISSKYPCNPNPTVRLKDLNDSTILVYFLPNSLKLLDDTVTVDIYF